MKTLKSLGEQLTSQAKALGRPFVRARGAIDLGKLTPANLRAAAADAAEAFVGHFRAAPSEATAEAASGGGAAPAP